MKVETRSERSNRYESQSTHCFTTPFDLNFFAKHSLFRLPIVAEDFRNHFLENASALLVNLTIYL